MLLGASTRVLKLGQIARFGARDRRGHLRNTYVVMLQPSPVLVQFTIEDTLLSGSESSRSLHPCMSVSNSLLLAGLELNPQPALGADEAQVDHVVRQVRSSKDYSAQ